MPSPLVDVPTSVFKALFEATLNPGLEARAEILRAQMQEVLGKIETIPPPKRDHRIPSLYHASGLHAEAKVFENQLPPPASSESEPIPNQEIKNQAQLYLAEFRKKDETNAKKLLRLLQYKISPKAVEISEKEFNQLIAACVRNDFLNCIKKYKEQEREQKGGGLTTLKMAEVALVNKDYDYRWACGEIHHDRKRKKFTYEELGMAAYPHSGNSQEGRGERAHTMIDELKREILETEYYTTFRSSDIDELTDILNEVDTDTLRISQDEIGYLLRQFAYAQASQILRSLKKGRGKRSDRRDLARFCELDLVDPKVLGLE